MTQEKNNRTKWIHIRVTTKEHETINQSYKSTTCRALSEYARKKILDKPVTVFTRNRSIDDLMAELILVRAQFSAIGNNYNQVVKKLHTLRHVHEIKIWLMIHEKIKENLLKKIEETKSAITTLFEKWSLSSKEVPALPGHSTTTSTNAAREGQN